MKTQNLAIICFTVIMSLLIMGMIVSEANAQTIEPTPTVIAADEPKYQLIQLLLQLIAMYQAQLDSMQSEPVLEQPEQKIVEKKDVISVTSQGPGEFVERSEDLSKTVTLATFAVYAEKESLSGSTFRALVRDIPYGEPRVIYSCPDIKKGATKTCRVKVTGVGGYSAIKYSIQDVQIEAQDGSVYRGKFPAVEGLIKNQ
jgi:hypothetical protein